MPDSDPASPAFDKDSIRRLKVRDDALFGLLLPLFFNRTQVNKYLILKLTCYVSQILSSSYKVDLPPLGENEAVRTYIEFADGTNRGMYDPATNGKGYPDEDFDGTTAMVINLDISQRFC